MLKINKREITDNLALINLKKSGLTDTIAECLVRRGVSNPDVAKMQHKIIPFKELKGVSEMAEGIAKAIMAKEKIVVVADYDCDGATACAIAVSGIEALGGDIDFVVPNRLVHGYGLTPSVVDVANEKKPKWIITVDNGIASIDGVNRANELGVGVWVTDHHLPGDELPDAAGIVNPNQPGCKFPSKNLAGVGVMFYVLGAVNKELKKYNWPQSENFNISEWLDLVALGTVADVVKLDDNNRWLVHHGLQRIKAGLVRPGILALFNVSGRDYSRATAQDFGFSLGPRLNAAGRLDDMATGIKCLLSKDYTEAEAIALELSKLNEERKEIEGEMKAIAMNNIDTGGQSEMFTRVIFGCDFHEGVIGIVAGRIKEKDFAPTIVFAPAQEHGLWKGSGRSIPGLHLRDVIDIVYKKNPDWFVKFGGHSMAAGLTIKEDARELFHKEFEAAVRVWFDNVRPEQALLIDGTLDDHEINISTAKSINEHVWGQGFEEPTWLGSFTVSEVSMIGKDKNHLKMKLISDDGVTIYNAIHFFQNEDSAPMVGDEISIAYRMQVNVFRNEEKLDLLIIDRE